MISLINAARLAAGKSSLGWLNPTLYAQFASNNSPSFYNDIVVGENNCAASNKVCCSQGYSAVPGWDPVTGLGSVDFQRFKTALMTLVGNKPNTPTLSPTVSPGMPTTMPVVTPTVTPSLAPTPSPTMNAG